VVGVAHRIGRAREVDRAPPRHLDDHDPLLSRRPDARLGHAHRRAADLADLAAAVIGSAAKAPWPSIGLGRTSTSNF
jgi:hypothetical protein